MRYLAILYTISALMFACKKDKLEGDKSIFVGTWNWVQSEHIFNACTGDPPEYETLTSDTEGVNYSMEFLKKGKVEFFKNGESLDRARVVFDLFVGTCSTLPNYLQFYINLDNDNDDLTKKLNGCIKQDTLIIIHGFPYELATDNPCESYTSSFVKQ